MALLWTKFISLQLHCERGLYFFSQTDRCVVVTAHIYLSLHWLIRDSGESMWSNPNQHGLPTHLLVSQIELVCHFLPIKFLSLHGYKVSILSIMLCECQHWQVSSISYVDPVIIIVMIIIIISAAEMATKPKWFLPPSTWRRLDLFKGAGHSRFPCNDSCYFTISHALWLSQLIKVIAFFFLIDLAQA